MSKKYVATISFGKDSTVMVDLLLKNNYPVDYIIFTDTMLEFPMMYEYKEKVIKYFKERYNKEVIVTKPKDTFEDWCFGTMQSGEMKGWTRGIPMVWAEPCYWRRESKIRPKEALEKEFLKDTEFSTYIGFTLDEANRKMEKSDNPNESFLYPLIDDFKYTELMCNWYLQDHEMENPLYKYFTRTGCSVCPAQSDKAWFQIWKHFPGTWGYMKDIERELQELEDIGEKIKNKTWFNEFRTCEDMEKLFKKKDQQGSLFDFSDEPLKDCFCKI